MPIITVSPKKIIACCTAVFLVLPAPAFNRSTAAQIAPDLVLLRPISENPAPFSFKIPRSLGTIQESFQGSSGRTILFIQDAHDSLEAQEHIASMLTFAVRFYGVKTVLEEGFEGPVELKKNFALIRDTRLRKKLAYFFMDQLKLGGAEFAYINRTQEFKLIGADSERLHRDNIRAYQQARLYREQVDNQLYAIEWELAQLANRVFSDPMNEWLKNRERFESSSLDLIDYLRRTNIAAGDSLKTRYPGIAQILLASADSESAKRMDLSGLDAVLLKEIDSLDREFSKIWLNSEKEKKLFKFIRSIRYFKKINEMRLPGSDVESALKALEDFSTDEAVSFIADESGRAVILEKKWETDIKAAVKFYEIAAARELFAESAIQDFLTKSNEPVAALVYGGFHKEGLRNMMRKLGVSYHIIAPVMCGHDRLRERAYEELMVSGTFSGSGFSSQSQASRPWSVFERWKQMSDHSVLRELTLAAETVTNSVFRSELRTDNLSSADEKKSKFVRELKLSVEAKRKDIIGQAFTQDGANYQMAEKYAEMFYEALNRVFDFVTEQEDPSAKIREHLAVAGFGGVGRRLIFGASSDFDLILLVDEAVPDHLAARLKDEIWELLSGAIPTFGRDFLDVSKLSALQMMLEGGSITPLDKVQFAQSRFLFGSERLHTEMLSIIDYSKSDFDSIGIFNLLIRRIHRQAQLDGFINMKITQGGFVDLMFLYDLANYRSGFAFPRFEEAIDSLMRRGDIDENDKKTVMSTLGVLTYIRVTSGKRLMSEQEWTSAAEAAIGARELEALLLANTAVVKKVEMALFLPLLGLEKEGFQALLNRDPQSELWNVPADRESLRDIMNVWNIPDGPFLEQRFLQELDAAEGDLARIPWLILAAFAANPETPPHILAQFFKLKNDFRYREIITLTALNPKTWPSTLLKMMEDPQIRPIDKGRASMTYQRLASKAEYSAPDLILTYHGRLSEIKNLKLLLDTAKRVLSHLSPRGQRMTLEILGGQMEPDAYEKELKKMVVKEGLEEIVVFRGPYEADQLAKIYDLFPREKRIFISTGLKEAFGLNTLEALMMGIPAVAPDRGGTQDIIRTSDGGQAGVVVHLEASREDQFAEIYSNAVLELFDDPLLWQKARQRAAEAAQKFTRDTMAKKYFDQAARAAGRRENITFHYISPGLYPYQLGGVPEWARQLILGWSDLAAQGVIPEIKVSATTLQRDSDIPENQRASLGALKSFDTVKPGLTAVSFPEKAELDHEIAPLLIRFLGRILDVQEADREDVFLSNPAAKSDIELLYKLRSLMRHYDFEKILDAVGEQAFEKALKARSLTLMPGQWEVVRNGLFKGNGFNLLNGPLADSSVLYNDSTNRFNLLGVISKFYTDEGSRDTPSALIQGQHSQGGKDVLENLYNDTALDPLAKAVLVKAQIFSLSIFYEFSDLIIAVSEAMARHVKEDYHASQAKVVVIENGIDPAPFARTETLRLGAVGYLRDARNPGVIRKDLGKARWEQLQHHVSTILISEESTLEQNIRAIEDFIRMLPPQYKYDPPIVFSRGSLTQLERRFEKAPLKPIFLSSDGKSRQELLVRAHEESVKLHSTITLLLDGGIRYDAKNLLSRLKRLLDYRDAAVLSTRQTGSNAPLDFAFYTSRFSFRKDRLVDDLRALAPFLVFDGESDSGSKEWDLSWKRRLEGILNTSQLPNLIAESPGFQDSIPRNSTVVFLEPHQDDLVLSSSTLVRRFVRRGNRVIVLGIMSEIPPKAIQDKMSAKDLQEVLNRDSKRDDENAASFAALYEQALREAEPGSLPLPVVYVPLRLGMTQRGLAVYRQDGSIVGGTVLADPANEIEKNRLLTEFQKWQPDWVLIPFSSDGHDAHVKTAHLGREVLEQYLETAGKIVRGFEVPLFSADIQEFTPTDVIVETETDHTFKLKLLSHYASQEGLLNAEHPLFQNWLRRNSAEAIRSTRAALAPGETIEMMREIKLRSELRLPKAENSQGSIDKEMILINFQDAVENFSEDQWREILFFIRNQNPAQFIGVYEFDEEHPLAALFTTRRSKNIKVVSGPQDKLLKGIQDKQHMNFIFLTSRALAKKSSQFRSSLIRDADPGRVYVLAYPDETSGALGAGRAGLQYFRLHKQLPEWMAVDPFEGWYYVLDSSVTESWNRLYAESVSFASSA